MLINSFCGPCYYCAALSIQASLDETIYIVTEGRFTMSVNMDYKHPHPFKCLMETCFLKGNVGNWYWDIDDVVVTPYVTGVKPADWYCNLSGWTNPDDVPQLFVGRNYQNLTPFYTSTHEEKDALLDLIHDLKKKRDNAVIRPTGGVSKTSKRVFVASGSDPSNFSLFMIETDNWASFLLQMKEKFALSSVSSVKIAEVNIAVSSIDEISANDKLVIY